MLPAAAAAPATIRWLTFALASGSLPVDMPTLHMIEAERPNGLHLGIEHLADQTHSREADPGVARQASSTQRKSTRTRPLRVSGSSCPAGVDRSRNRPPVRWLGRVSVRLCDLTPTATDSSTSVRSCRSRPSRHRNGLSCLSHHGVPVPSATRASASGATARSFLVSSCMELTDRPRHGPTRCWTFPYGGASGFSGV